MSDEEDYYQLLGVPRKATASEIKQAFRSLAKTHHPDKGGDPERFKAISHAASVLQDPEQRAAYDRGESLTNGRDVHHKPQRRRPQVVVQVPATLEEIFSGADKPVTFEWEKPCLACHSSGCKAGKRPVRCRTCEGRGMVLNVRHLGPGVVQQTAVVCSSCHGERVYICRSDRCANCHGKRAVPTKETVTVHVPPGAPNRARIFPSAEGLRGFLEDDVVFVASEQPHSRFERVGPHLICKQSVALVEALTGITASLRHLDGQDIRLTTPPGTVTKPNSLFIVAHQGLPHPAAPGTDKARGDLLIRIDIQFPAASDLPPAVQHILKRCLPSLPATAKPSSPEVSSDAQAKSAPPSSAQLSAGNDEKLAAERPLSATVATGMDKDEKEKKEREKEALVMQPVEPAAAEEILRQCARPPHFAPFGGPPPHPRFPSGMQFNAFHGGPGECRPS